MQELTLTFNSHIPSKKNSRRNFGNVLLPSKAYQQWEKTELASLFDAPKFVGPVAIDYEFYPGTLRLFDLSNAIESVNDLLVKAEIIRDDNWLTLRQMNIKLAGYAARAEHCVATIRSVAETEFDNAIAALRDQHSIKLTAMAQGITQKAAKQHYEELAREIAA
ncbi:MAG: hypothetical protein ACFB2W_00905 [Leptolyngbyaceae cyanobacterium]